MSLPGVGPGCCAKYQHPAAERRVADVIATCFSDPRLFPPARFAAEVTELARRDTLDYAAAAMVGSIRTLTAETFRAGGRPAWRDAARITAPPWSSTARRPPGRCPDGGPGRARVLQRPDRGDAEHRSRRAHGASRLVAAEIGVLLADASRPAGQFRALKRAGRGNSRSLPPVDRGTAEGQKPGSFGKSVAAPPGRTRRRADRRRGEALLASPDHPRRRDDRAEAAEERQGAVRRRRRPRLARAALPGRGRRRHARHRRLRRGGRVEPAAPDHPRPVRRGPAQGRVGPGQHRRDQPATSTWWCTRSGWTPTTSWRSSPATT
jgi:hypothetical protein